MAAGRFTPPLTPAKAWRRPLSQASIILPLRRRTCEQINMSDVSTFYRRALIGHRISCNAGFMDDVIRYSLSSGSNLERRRHTPPRPRLSQFPRTSSTSPTFPGSASGGSTHTCGPVGTGSCGQDRWGIVGGCFHVLEMKPLQRSLICLRRFGAVFVRRIDPKLLFPEARSPEGRANQIPQSNISATISAPKGKSNICPFSPSPPTLHARHRHRHHHPCGGNSSATPSVI